MRQENVLDIMLDLEFFGTEEDMVLEYPGQDAFPIVSSIGMVIQFEGEHVFSKNFALNFSEQVQAGAKFGKRCMLEFWTQQPLLGDELARTMEQDEPIHRTLMDICGRIKHYKELYPTAKVQVLGNNLLADNAKVIRLFAKYGYSELPWSYFENADYRELTNVARYLGFDKAGAERDFEEAVLMQEYSKLFTEPALHNAEYDCLKQLFVLNKARAFLKETKAKLRGTNA